jgi:iron(III) transport system permease protein
MTAVTGSRHVARRTADDTVARLGRHAVVLAVAVVFVAPGVFVVWRALRLGGSFNDTLGELAGPAWRTALLVGSVSVTTAVLGTALAWLVTCTDLPLRRLWRLLLIVPIALPSFVTATAVLAGFTPGGPLRGLWGLLGLEAPRRIRGFVPAWIVLSASTYPFVMMPVSARLRVLSPSLDESARLLGSSSWRVFHRITLPQIRTAIAGGALIVALYMCSEFGAVQLLGYDTLTRVIYATRQLDRATSFAAAAILFAASTLLVWAVRAASRTTMDDRTSVQPTRPVRLGRWTPVGLVVCLLTIGVGLVAPLSSLVVWAVRGIREDRLDTDALGTSLGNTAMVAVVAAVVTLVAVLPVAQGTVRRGDASSRLAAVAVVSGFALPAIVIALSIAVLTLNTPGLDQLYQTMPLLVLAYVVHFGSQALGSVEQAVRGVAPPMLDSANLLEPSRWRRFQRIELPLMRPGLVSGAGLVMLAVVKELPATLLLAPVGFRTLSTEVWNSFEEGFLADAAVGSLIMVVVSASFTWLLVVRERVTPGV